MCRWCRCSPTRPSPPACCTAETEERQKSLFGCGLHGFTLISLCKQTWGSSVTYLLHTVVHRQERLQSLPLQHVGELHVNGLHGAGVTHDPVLVWVRSVVITGSTGGGGERKRDRRCWGEDVSTLRRRNLEKHVWQWRVTTGSVDRTLDHSRNHFTLHLRSHAVKSGISSLYSGFHTNVSQILTKKKIRNLQKKMQIQARFLPLVSGRF